MLAIVPSRLVILVDQLEERGLVDRRDHPDDRRRGSQATADIGQVARAHNQALCVALSAEEREQLVGLLERIADQQQLTPGVHPGFRQLAPGEDTRQATGGSKRGRPSKA